MPIECADRSKSWMLTIVLFSATALATMPVEPVKAQSDVRNTPAWGEMFASQVGKCWQKSDRVIEKVANAKIVLEISLDREGRLVGEPLVSPESSPAASDYVKAYQESALRAVKKCQPYALPSEDYDKWKRFMPVFLDAIPPNEKGKRPAGLFDTRTPSICKGC